MLVSGLAMGGLAFGSLASASASPDCDASSGGVVASLTSAVGSGVAGSEGASTERRGERRRIIGAFFSGVGGGLPIMLQGYH